MKKRIALILAVLMVCVIALPSCGEKGDTAGKTVGKIEDVKGETIDAGRVSALCPEGWMNFPVKDLFADDPNTIVTNKLEFRKGAKSVDDYTKPGLTISLYGENETFYKLNKEDYEDSSDIAPIELGGRTWEGFTATSSGYKYVWLWTGESDSAEEYLINFMTEYGDVKISIDDIDVQAIIASIKAK